MIPIYEGKKVIALYTDGACSGNQNETNIGGYGAILEYAGAVKEIHGGEENTTNNRMEMKALLEGLKALKKEGLSIAVFSDSSYVMDCFRQKWYVSWEKNGWKNSKKQPVENRDLWEPLLALYRQHNIVFYRVKGHINLNGKTYQEEPEFQRFVQWNGAVFSREDYRYVIEKNNRADELANIAMDEIRESKK